MGHQNGFGVELPSFAGLGGFGPCTLSSLGYSVKFDSLHRLGGGSVACTLLSLSSLQLLCGRAGGVRQLGRQLLNGVHFDENKKKSFVIVL